MHATTTVFENIKNLEFVDGHMLEVVNIDVFYNFQLISKQKEVLIAVQQSNGYHQFVFMKK